MATKEQVQHARRQIASALGSEVAVVATGITGSAGDYHLKVNLDRRSYKILPTMIAGVPVDYDVTGPISKQQRAG